VRAEKQTLKIRRARPRLQRHGWTSAAEISVLPAGGGGNQAKPIQLNHGWARIAVMIKRLQPT